MYKLLIVICFCLFLTNKSYALYECGGYYPESYLEGSDVKTVFKGNLVHIYQSNEMNHYQFATEKIWKGPETSTIILTEPINKKYSHSLFIVGFNYIGVGIDKDGKLIPPCYMPPSQVINEKQNIYDISVEDILDAVTNQSKEIRNKRIAGITTNIVSLIKKDNVNWFGNRVDAIIVKIDKGTESGVHIGMRFNTRERQYGISVFEVNEMYSLAVYYPGKNKPLPHEGDKLENKKW